MAGSKPNLESRAAKKFNNSGFRIQRCALAPNDEQRGGSLRAGPE
jgi:hypothetical protein